MGRLSGYKLKTLLDRDIRTTMRFRMFHLGQSGHAGEKTRVETCLSCDSAVSLGEIIPQPAKH